MKKLFFFAFLAGLFSLYDCVEWTIEDRGALGEKCLGSGNFGKCADGLICKSGKCEKFELEWASIAGGDFSMGCVDQDENCNSDETPRHLVNVKPFQITISEVTQLEYFSLMKSRPSNTPNCPECPVDSVSWNEAKSFCETAGGRLPTEAEWEFAARAGSKQIYYCGDAISCVDGIAWIATNSNGATQPRKQKTPNAFGLYDMSGNVWEWVEDWHHTNYNGAPSDGSAWIVPTSEKKAARGGSFSEDADGSRLSNRTQELPSKRYINFGIRCAKDIIPQETEKEESEVEADGDDETEFEIEEDEVGEEIPYEETEEPTEDENEETSDGDVDLNDETEEEIEAEEEGMTQGKDMSWVIIKGAYYDMGCSVNDNWCDTLERPRHTVLIQTFAMNETEITQWQYYNVKGKNPSKFQPPNYPECPDCPVENVTYDEAKSFCALVGGRLATEAEWEYAARGGGYAKYECGEDYKCVTEYSWFSDNSNGRTRETGRKKPNAYGLFDMIGNASEWVSDYYHADYEGAPTDGSSWVEPPTNNRAQRGANYSTVNSHDLRVSSRIWSGAFGYRDPTVGFRCVKPIAPNFVSIRGGSFKMGCLASDTSCVSAESPAHDVKLPSFMLMEAPVTQKQYEVVAGSNPSKHAGCANCPVENVSWLDAADFCNKIGARLPSESEFEYAARAGKSTVYICGNDQSCAAQYAWYDANSDNLSRPVKTKLANDWNLYDMSGNVWQWVADNWHDSYEGAPSDGGVWLLNPTDEAKTIRGGSFQDGILEIRVSYRTYFGNPVVSAENVGFRCAKDIPVEWVELPASDTFNMGCLPDDTNCASDESPRHLVNITAPFKIMQFEVSQWLYKTILVGNPSYFQPANGQEACFNCPVENVSWREAQTFCELLGGRLPTEAEWEYAARGGTDKIYLCGSSSCMDDHSWLGENANGKTHPIGEKFANGYGLYDMFGNVYEWVIDRYHLDYAGAPADGSAWTDGTEPYVYRGGYFASPVLDLRGSKRFKASSDSFYDKTIGVRCVKQ